MEAITDWHKNKLKPSSFTIFCLLCKVKDSRQPDVFLDPDKADKSGVKKSAYYFAFSQLEDKKWIKFTRVVDGKKRWALLKGFSANVENTESTNAENDHGNSANVENDGENLSADVENSANVEDISNKIPQTWNENSANVEIPPNPPIRINIPEIKEFKEGESLSPRAPAREEEIQKPEGFDDLPEREKFDNGKTGYAVHEMLGIERDPEFIDFRNTIVEGLKIRHGTKAQLPKRDEWEARIETAWRNEFPAEQCLEAYDLLKKIYAKKNLHFPVTPGNWENNIPRIEALRTELKELEKGAVKPNGNKPKGGGGTTKSDELSDQEWRELNDHLLPDYGEDEDGDG